MASDRCRLNWILAAARLFRAERQARIVIAMRCGSSLSTALATATLSRPGDASYARCLLSRWRTDINVLHFIASRRLRALRVALRVAPPIGLAAGVMAGPAAARIVIGQTAGFTGIAAAVKEITGGARLCLDAVNARGGVGGQKIELRSLDDQFEPKLAAENAQKLVADPKLVALLLSRGTPHTQAILPVLEASRMPLIGPPTGAVVFHQPVNPWVFNLRATCQREAEKAVMHLASIGVARIAMLQVDDSFGANFAAGAQKGLRQARLEPVVHLKFDRAKPDFAPIGPAVVKSNAQAVVFIGTAGAVVEGVKALRSAGSTAQIVTLSNNASAGFVKQLGEHAHCTIVAQVFPSERSLAVPLIKEAHDLGCAKGLAGVTPAMIEGFAAARVLVEGLKRAGADPRRQSLVSALNGLAHFDLGGLEVSYPPTDHTGLDYADLSIVGADGRFMR
jgi:ABC-type branched-subunit amino acid transport system substrate-binding protein